MTKRAMRHLKEIRVKLAATPWTTMVQQDFEAQLSAKLDQIENFPASGMICPRKTSCRMVTIRMMDITLVYRETATEIIVYALVPRGCQSSNYWGFSP
ncbi:MAG: type II toxin-antitoxin system RelE/ParE family toxin [Verrucomicrobiales bacterium]|jgi:hypothetical protein|nr:type II toxin-antitoxin system RelE/ParE family toxin [Verrucomicrobiales bacterium]